MELTAMEHYLARLRRTICAYDVGIEHQAEIVNRHLDVHTTAAALSVSIYDNLQRSQAIVANHAHKMSAAWARELRDGLFRAYAHRGEMLVRAAKTINAERLIDVMQESGCLDDETVNCIHLYLNWNDFRTAEKWNHGSQGPPPEDLADALRLIDLWNALGRPA